MGRLNRALPRRGHSPGMNAYTLEHVNRDLLTAITSLAAESFSSSAWGDEDGWVPASTSLRSRESDEWTAEDFATARADSRHVCRYNEYAIGGLKARKNYVLGDGLSYDLAPAPGVSPEAAAAVMPPAKDFLAAFLELNAMPQLEAETLLRYDRDGEGILRLFPADGIPEVRIVESQYLVDPPDVGDDTTIRQGVQFDPKDNQRRIAYWISYDGKDPQPVPEAEIVHLRANADSSLARGIPTYFPVIENLERCEDLLKSMSTTTKVRAKIAVLWKLSQLTQRTEDNLKARLTSKVQTSARGDQQVVSTETMPFGSILRVSDKDTLEFPGANLDIQGIVENLQAELRGIGCALQMAEWMFTSLADQKYSNAFVVEAPTLREFKSIQTALRNALGEGRMRGRASIVWRAMKMGVAAGLVPPAALSLLRVTCTAPTLEVRNQLEEAQVNQTYVAMGAKSVPTVQRQLGLDPETERRQGATPYVKVTGAADGGPPANPAPNPTPNPAPPTA